MSAEDLGFYPDGLASTSELRPLADARVLAIDDEPVSLELLERILNGGGFTNVRTTTDPRTVLTEIVEFHPDLILLDMRMPQMDGFAVMEQVRSMISDDDFLPIVVLTADVSPVVRDQALSSGAADYVTKPYDRTEVLLRVRNLLHRRMMHVVLRDQNRALASRLRDRELFEQRVLEQEQQRLASLQCLRQQGPRMVFQPIYDLPTGRLIGVEALARFDHPRQWGPDRWMSEAAALGLGVELELDAVKAAVNQLATLPSHSYLAVNVSPRVVLSGQLDPLLAPHGSRVVLELTEHAEVEDYDALSTALAGLRSAGVRIAVDDAGSGFASLSHILKLNPDIIKLDLELTRGIDTDPARRALATALVAFARERHEQIVAEGIETETALSVLRQLGVDCGQGFHLCPPTTAAGLRPALGDVSGASPSVC